MPHPGNMRAGPPAGRWATGRADVSWQPRGGPPPSLVAPAVAAGVFGQPGELVVRVPSLDVGAVLLGDLFLRVALRPRRGGRDGVSQERPGDFPGGRGRGTFWKPGSTRVIDYSCISAQGISVPGSSFGFGNAKRRPFVSRNPSKGRDRGAHLAALWAGRFLLLERSRRPGQSVESGPRERGDRRSGKGAGTYTLRSAASAQGKRKG